MLTLARSGSHHTQTLCCGPGFFSTQMGTKPCKEQKKENHIQASQVFVNDRGLSSCSFSFSTTVITGSSAWDPELFFGSQGLILMFNHYVSIVSLLAFMMLLPSPSAKSQHCAKKAVCSFNQVAEASNWFSAELPGISCGFQGCSSRVYPPAAKSSVVSLV